MSKTYIHTRDIFDISDQNIRGRYFDFCYNKALECGIECRCYVESNVPNIELWGSKCQLIKYYLVTLTKCSHKLDGVKRLISVIF